MVGPSPGGGVIPRRPERALLLAAVALAICIVVLVALGHVVPAVLAWGFVAALAGALGATVPAAP